MSGTISTLRMAKGLKVEKTRVDRESDDEKERTSDEFELDMTEDDRRS